MSANAPSVAVCCRVRPRNARADSEQGQDAFTLQNSAVYPREGANRTTGYPFDRVFGPSSTQQDVFDAIGKPMVRAALEGFNATILSYGQVRGRPMSSRMSHASACGGADGARSPASVIIRPASCWLADWKRQNTHNDGQSDGSRVS
jgi:hypothetical protein